MITQDDIVKILQNSSRYGISHFHYNEVAKRIIEKINEDKNIIVDEDDGEI